MYQIVKFVFPFTDDFKKGKPRPAVVISPSFGKHKQTILAFITTDLKERLDTDIFIGDRLSYFSQTGLRSSSVLKLHRLITTDPSQIGDVIGILPEQLIPQVKKKLIKIFQLQ